MKSLTDSLGLYLHIPFCEKRCKYCNFYSSFLNEELLDKYTTALIKSIKKWGGQFNGRPINTIYLGGGTPSLLNSRLEEVLGAVRNSFDVTNNAEITLELNPTGGCSEILENAKKAGINRLSIGAQSGIDDELHLLGRTHTADDTICTVEKARELGFDNISLDIMLGLPNSNEKTLEKTLDFIYSLCPEHISTYILKIEENTAFFHNSSSLNLPDCDAQSDQYLQVCDYLNKKGYSHYEISNFCKSDFQSLHNLKYWQGKEYLGIGPSAHSYISNKRFYYPDDLKSFINGNSPIPDGDGGGIEEYIMLSLRLKSGISLQKIENDFNIKPSHNFYEKLILLEKHTLLTFKNNTITLTDKGMLVSNSIITELLECIQ